MTKTLLSLAAALFAALSPVISAESEWRSLFNGRDLQGFDTYLAAKPGADRAKPFGLNNDPLGVFTVVQKDGGPAIRVSGEVYGAITTHDSFENHHVRVEYKWGQQKWPPRAQPKHHRDSGILYWCIGPHGAGSDAWMRSVECNIMEKGVGQWWAVAGTYVDIEGRKVVLEKEPSVPYRGESRGEECIVYEPGGPQFTTGEGITSKLDPEKTNDWNVCEVIAWGNVGIHILNGEVVLVLTNPRYREKTARSASSSTDAASGREFALTRGKLQFQSEGAELFYRKIEARTISEIPPALLSHVPPSSPDEKGFVPLFGKDARDGWAQCGPGHFHLNNGVANSHGGMGLWWHTNRMFTNFVLRGEFVQEGEIANSGIFFRFPDPANDPWVAVHKGHEVEIGDPKPKKPADATGSFYPFHAPAEVPIKPYGEWNSYELTCIGHNYSFRLNGKLINTWADPKQRSLYGYVGLQNYNDDKTVRHRTLRIKDLPPGSPE